MLAGKRGSRRHSTTTFNDNVVLTETGYQMLDRRGLTSFTNNDNSANFLVEKKRYNVTF